MRQPGIVGLHTVTTINAMHFAYTAMGNDETRQLPVVAGGGVPAAFRDGRCAWRAGNLGWKHERAGAD